MSNVRATAHATSTATDVVNYVNTLLDLTEKQPLDLAGEIKKGTWGAVVNAVLPLAPKLFDLDAETDVEGTFRMLFDLVVLLPQDQAVVAANQYLAAVLIKAQDDKAVLRLRIATHAFNKSTGLGDFRFDTMLAILDFAMMTDNLSLLSSYVDDIEALFDAKSLSAAQRRQLLLKAADVLSKDESNSLKVLLVLEKYLDTFAMLQDAKDLAPSKAVALKAVEMVVKSPVTSFLARVDIASNPAVQALKSDAKQAKLVELLEIMSSKTLVEYKAFQKSAGSVFADYGLKEDECLSHMRLFTLCALPADLNELPFATVAAALEISENEVEQWVVQAITANLITAKVDQLRHTVVIARTLQRGFSMDNWKETANKLQLYKQNVGKLLELVRSARQAHEKK